VFTAELSLLKRLHRSCIFKRTCCNDDHDKLASGWGSRHHHRWCLWRNQPVSVWLYHKSRI